MTMTAQLTGILQVAITVKDIERATAFYRNVLGLPLLLNAPNMAFFDCGGIRIMLGIADRPDLDHPASIIYYKVDDIERVYETFKARGVEFTAPIADHRYGFVTHFKAPGNFQIQLYQPKYGK